MIYKDFQGMKLSALGFGAMRLPVIDGDDGRIDEAAALRMVDTAMQNGINYYDTAWGYHGENSELVMGKALSRYPRDSFYVATKFPGYDPSYEAETKRKDPAPWLFMPWEHACASALSGCLWQGYGVLPAAVKLSGLDLPERQG